MAATGPHGGIELAVRWLLTHVYDSTLDEHIPREYILYLCPDGPLLNEIKKFCKASLEQCEWNESHNYLPHITLCSFFQVIQAINSIFGSSNFNCLILFHLPSFQAFDECEGLLVNALQDCFQKMSNDLPSSITLKPYISNEFMGLFVDESQSDALRRFSLMFMRECTDFGRFITLKSIQSGIK